MTRYRVTATKPGCDPVVFEHEFMSIAVWYRQTNGTMLEQAGWTVSDVEAVRVDDDPTAEVIPFEPRTVAAGGGRAV